MSYDFESATASKEFDLKVLNHTQNKSPKACRQTQKIDKSEIMTSKDFNGTLNGTVAGQ